VEVRWRRALFGERVRVRIDGAWFDVADTVALLERLRE